jgi:hypothetical protein
MDFSDADFIACDFKKLLYGKYKLSVDEIKVWEIVGDGTVILFGNRVVVKYHEFIKCNEDQEKKENFLISSFSNFIYGLKTVISILSKIIILLLYRNKNIESLPTTRRFQYEINDRRTTTTNTVAICNRKNTT